jgi:hypothetical protein
VDRLFFGEGELLDEEVFADFGRPAFFSFGFGFATRCGVRFAFAGFFSRARPRAIFFECFAKTLCL